MRALDLNLSSNMADGKRLLRDLAGSTCCATGLLQVPVNRELTSIAARIEGMVPMKLDDFFKHFEAKNCAASVASLGGEHTAILKQDTATSKTLT